MATTDLLSPEEAREVLGRGAADVTKGTALARAVTAVSDRIAAGVGPIVYGTLTESFDGGCSSVWLKGPVQSIVSVVEYDSTTAGTLAVSSNSSQPDNAYWADTESGELVRRSGNADGRFPVGRRNVVVTYVAGRCASTATVPERYKEAAAVALKSWWRTYESGVGRTGEYDVPQASFPTFAVPKAVKDMLADEWRTGSGIGD